MSGLLGKHQGRTGPISGLNGAGMVKILEQSTGSVSEWQFNNVFDNSDDYDIKLSSSYDTVSYNNTFSDIIVQFGANMWVKVDFDLIVYDNSSATFLDADVEVKQDDLVVYSSSYFGCSDPKTNLYGTIDSFLICFELWIKT